ncbi:MAG: amino acid ABC transporter substrate-binding protein [Janthinobacterium lividum]
MITRRTAAAGLFGTAGALLAVPHIARADEPIRLGIALSLSGNLGDSGAEFFRGVELWQEQVNAKGGLLGRQTELIKYDDRSDPATAARLYERLITSDKVDLLLSPWGSASCATASAVAERHKRVFVNAGGAAESIHTRGYKYVFQSAPPVSAYVSGVGPIAQKYGFKTMAIVARDYSAARDMAKVLEGISRENGIKIVATEYFPAGTSDFSANIANARQLQPDIWIGIGYPNEAIEQIRQFHAVNYLPKIFIHNGAALDDFLKATGKDGEFAVAMSLYEPTLRTNGNEAFVTAFKAKYGSAPGYYSAFPFQGATVLERAVTKTGSLDQDKLRETLTTFETDGIMGHHKVNPVTYGQIGLTGLLDQIRGGKREIISPDAVKTIEPALPMPAWDKR